MHDTLEFPRMLNSINQKIFKDIIVDKVLIAIHKSGGLRVAYLVVDGFDKWIEAAGGCRHIPINGDFSMYKYIYALGDNCGVHFMVEDAESIHRTFIGAIEDNLREAKIGDTLAYVKSRHGTLSVQAAIKSDFYITLAAGASSDSSEKVKINVKETLSWLENSSYGKQPI